MKFFLMDEYIPIKNNIIFIIIFWYPAPCIRILLTNLASWSLHSYLIS